MKINKISEWNLKFEGKYSNMVSYQSISYIEFDRGTDFILPKRGCGNGRYIKTDIKPIQSVIDKYDPTKTKVVSNAINVVSIIYSETYREILSIRQVGDEWFYVNTGLAFRSFNIDEFYKCDQMSGLIQCLDYILDLIYSGRS